LLAVPLPAPACGGIDRALHPLAARADRGGVHRRLGLAAIVLAPQPDDIGVAVVRAPHRRRAVPADIEPVAARPVQRQLERIDHDLRLRHRIDRHRVAQIGKRHAPRAGVDAVAAVEFRAGKSAWGLASIGDALVVQAPDKNATGLLD